MKLYIKRETQDYLIRFLVLDRQGKEKYKVKGKCLKLGENFCISDNHNTELAYIRKLIFPFISIYHISCAKKELALMEKRIYNLHPSYHILGIDWVLKKQSSPYSFCLQNKRQQIIMQQTKSWGLYGEIYELEIFQEEFKLLCLCISVCVDSLLIQEKKLPALG